MNLGKPSVLNFVLYFEHSGGFALWILGSQGRNAKWERFEPVRVRQPQTCDGSVAVIPEFAIANAPLGPQ